MNIETQLNELERYSHVPNVYAQFSSVNTLTIRPGHVYWTPTGIYAYPWDSETYQRYVDGSVTFAGDRAFVHLLRPKNPRRVPDISTLDKLYLTSSVSVLKSAYFDIVSDRDIDNWIAASRKRSSGGKLYNVTREIAKRLAGVTDEHVHSDARIAKHWRRVLMMLGLEGLRECDYTPRGGIISTDAERCQAVFFSLNSVEHLATVRNDPFARQYKHLDALVDKVDGFNQTTPIDSLVNAFNEMTRLQSGSLTNAFYQEHTKELRFIRYRILHLVYALGQDARKRFEARTGFNSDEDENAWFVFDPNTQIKAPSYQRPQTRKKLPFELQLAKGAQSDEDYRQRRSS